MNLPPGFRIDYTGESEDMMESFEYVGQSLMLAVILIYAILASQFRSFLPLAIMPSLPLSLVGVAGLLFLVGDTVDIMCWWTLLMFNGGQAISAKSFVTGGVATYQRRLNPNMCPRW